MHPHAVRIVPVFGIRIGEEVGTHAFVQRMPVGARIGRFEDAAARHPDVEMLRITRVDQDRVELRAIRRAVLVAAAPGLALRMLVEAVDAHPGRAAVGRAEESLRRRARVPHARLRRVARRQPERVVDAARAARLERRRRGGLLPRPAAIGGAEHRRAEVARARGDEERLPVARILHRVMHDAAEKMRTGKLPRAPRGIARERPEALAGRDQQAGARRPARRGRALPGSRRHVRPPEQSSRQSYRACANPARGRG